MAVTAKFQADFQSFYAAVDKAEAQLADFSKGAANVEKSLNRMVDNFSGRKLIQDATLMTKAIEDAGGVSKLTAKELEQAGNKAAEAAEKMRKLGLEVPPGMQKLADSAEAASSKWGKFGSLVGAAIGTVSVAAIVGATKSLLDFADSTVNVAEKTKFSTDAVQELTLAFQPHGISIDTVAQANEKLAKNLIGGDKSTVGALEKMGLSVAELKKLSPDDLFITVADAIGQIPNPAEQAFAAMTVFGKGGSELLAGLDGHLKETTESFKDMGVIIDEKTIKAADDFGDQLGRMGKQLLAVVGAIVGPMLPALSDLGNLLIKVAQIVGPIVSGAFKIAETAILGLWEGIAKFLASVADLAQKVPLVGKHLSGLGDAAQWLRSSATSAEDKIVKLWTSTEKSGDVAKVAATKLLGFGDAGEKAGKGSDAATKAIQALHDQIVKIEGTKAEFKTLSLAEAFKEMAATAPVPTMKDLADQSIRSATDVDALRGSTEELQRAGRFLSVEIANVNKHVGILMPAAAQEGKEALDELREGSLSLTETLVNAFTALPTLLVKAFTGGGGISGALNALGAKLGGDLFGEKGPFAGAVSAAQSGLSKVFGSTVGKALASAIPGIGALLGPALEGLAHLFGKLFGPSEDELAAREVFGKQFKDVNDLISQASAAYALMGKSGTDAEAAIKAALDATHISAEAERAALANINVVLEQAKQKAADIEHGVNAITTAAGNLRGGMTEAVAAAIQQLANMHGVTEDERKALLAIIDNTKPKFAELEQVAKNYGVSLEGLGSSFQQAHITETAQQIYKDFSDITQAGGDVGGVLAGMSDEINALVGDAIHFGASIPEAMRPLLDNLLQAGLLTDGAGNKLEDLSGITFSNTPLQTGMDALTQAITDLTNVLKGVPTAAKDAAQGLKDTLGNVKIPTITIPYEYQALNGVEGYGSAYGSHGGRVTAHGVMYAAEGAKVLRMMARGTDTVPAMLTPGERVLSVAQNKKFEAAGGLNGLGSGGLSIVVNAQGSTFDTPASREDLARRVSKSVMEELRRKTRLQVAV